MFCCLFVLILAFWYHIINEVLLSHLYKGLLEFWVLGLEMKVSLSGLLSMYSAVCCCLFFWKKNGRDWASWLSFPQCLKHKVALRAVRFLSLSPLPAFVLCALPVPLLGSIDVPAHTHLALLPPSTPVSAVLCEWDIAGLRKHRLPPSPMQC